MTSRSDRSHSAAWVLATVLAVTVLGLVAAVVTPAADQFRDKGWSVRLVAYPVLMLLAPIGWWLTRDRDGHARPPYGAFLLIMLPFCSDVAANWLDLFRRVGWWDEVSHLVHWFWLGSGIGLLSVGAVRPRWLVAPLVAGVGALSAVWWELGEWWLFIRHGKEAGGAYEDTLGDEALGVAGSIAAGVLVAWWDRRSRRRAPGVGGPA